MTATLEHTNFTVADPHATAAWMHKVFGWHTRWEGEAISGGYTVHVGSADTYLALYRPVGDLTETGSSYMTRHATNHIGVVVDDIDAAEARAKDLGYHPHNHGDYEPGRRFYIEGPQGLELELVAYD